MTEPSMTLKKLTEMEKRVTHLEKGGGSGNNGGMDAWQTSVESRLASLDDKMGKVSDGVSRIEIKLASLPDKWFIVATTIALFVLVIAAVALGIDLKPHK